MELMEAEELMTDLNAFVDRHSRNYISPLLLKKIYKDYCKWRDLINTRVAWWCSKQKEKEIHEFDLSMVRYLLKRCYCIRYKDSKIVCHLLSILLKLEGNFQTIIFSQLFTDIRLDIDCFFVGVSLRASSVETITPLNYFVQKAYESEVYFNNERFIEEIVEYGLEMTACHLTCRPPCTKFFKFPKMLPKLLSQGLFVSAKPEDLNVGKLLLCIIIIYATHRFDTVPSQIQEMGTILLRAVKSVELSILIKLLRDANCFRFVNFILNRVNDQIAHSVQKALEKVIEMDVLPKLRRRCSGPQELQHICRCSIRKSLYDSSMLPNGICFLPLPTSLKNYISLKID